MGVMGTKVRRLLWQEATEKHSRCSLRKEPDSDKWDSSCTHIILLVQRSNYLFTH